MLVIINSMSGLRFSELMDVYLESNQSNGNDLYFRDSPDMQLHKVQMDFYYYLQSVFFRQPDSFYAIWELQGRYVAALRLEPYADGLLLCGLETAPAARRKGYAADLVRAVVRMLAEQGSGILYSHVAKKNQPSLALHKKCGFQVTKDFAVYSDGSVLQNHVTLAYIYEKSEI